MPTLIYSLSTRCVSSCFMALLLCLPCCDGLYSFQKCIPPRFFCLIMILLNFLFICLLTLLPFRLYTMVSDFVFLQILCVCVYLCVYVCISVYMCVSLCVVSLCVCISVCTCESLYMCLLCFCFVFSFYQFCFILAFLFVSLYVF